MTLEQKEIQEFCIINKRDLSNFQDLLKSWKLEKLSRNVYYYPGGNKEIVTAQMKFTTKGPFEYQVQEDTSV